MMNYLPPAGTPVKLNEIVRWLYSAEKINSLNLLSAEIAQKFDTKHCQFLNTGRAAMSILLSSMNVSASASGRYKVILPAYTCYSVPASVVNAGLEPVFSDIDIKTLGYDISKLRNSDFSNVLAIITSNLYGIPDNLPAIEEIARDNNIYMIDDAAQAMGARINGRFVGTFGDAGIYSLDKGKNITSMNGGIIVTRDDKINRQLDTIISVLPSQSMTSNLIEIIKLVVYAVMLSPNRYWLLQKMPFLGLGKTIYTTDIHANRYSNRLANIAVNLFRKLDKINNTRINNAKKLSSILTNFDGISLPTVNNSSIEPVYLRLPIIFSEPTKRNLAITMLNKAGIGASCSYPQSLVELEELSLIAKRSSDQCPSARWVAKRILTLPTNFHLNELHIGKIIKILSRILGRRSHHD